MQSADWPKVLALAGPHWQASHILAVIKSTRLSILVQSPGLKMCDKEVEMIDLTLSGGSDEEEDSTRSGSTEGSTVVILSDGEDSAAFEYVRTYFNTKNCIVT